MSAMPRFRQLTIEEFEQLLHAFPFRRRVNEVHMHHTFRPNHEQYRRNPEAAIQGMWRFHTAERGFSDIAQHVTIGTEGEVWTGRHWDVPPASASGHNGNSVAGPFMIEIVGDFDSGNDPFEGQQRLSALRAITAVQRRFGLPPEALRFHNQMASRTCPGTAVDRDQMIGEVRALHEQQTASDATRKVSIFGPEADRARETVARVTELFFQPSDEISRSAGSHDHELPEEELTFEDERALERAIEGTRGTRGDLTHSDLDRLRPHVINLRFGQFSNTGSFRTTQADVERMFRETIPAAIAAAPKPFRLLFWAHGGLVGESNGLRIALNQIEFWKRNGIYPIFFVWETGLLETLGDILRSALPGQRGIFDLGSGLLDKFIESVARPGGVRMWGRMKRSAEVGVLEDGGALYVAQAAAELLSSHDGVEVHAAGHSAGSIFHSSFLPALFAAGVARVESLHLLAPAVNIPTFRRKLMKLSEQQLPHTTIYTMRRDLEEADSAGPYQKSLLYLVHHSFEEPDETPILGLEENLRADSEVARFFGLLGGPGDRGSVVFSTTGASGHVRARSNSVTHGGFDNDSDTLGTIARRILDSDTLKVAFPKGTRDLFGEELLSLQMPSVLSAPAIPAPPIPMPTAPAPPDSGECKKRALCVGINAYPAQYALNGCVADARNWGAALSELGYEVTYLLDAQANRTSILSAIERLVSQCQSGDIAVFQFAGHGTTLRDVNNDEEDARDEALCPVDMTSGAFIIDDDLRLIFDRVPQGSLLTCFIDCCHSGTVTRVFAGLSENNAVSGQSKARFVPFSSELQAAHENYRRTAQMRSVTPPLRGPDTMKEVLFSACLPSEVAYETNGNGDFTSRVIPLLRKGMGKITNAEFQEQITKAFGVPARQHPNLDCSPAMATKPLLKLV